GGNCWGDGKEGGSGTEDWLEHRLYPGFTKPAGTGPVTAVTGLTGRNRSGYRGYRSNRPGPVPVPAGFKPVQIQILNLNSKKWKNSKNILKILQVATNLMMSKFFKYSFI